MEWKFGDGRREEWKEYEVSKVDIRLEGENAGIFSERGNAEREIEGELGKEREDSGKGF